MNTVKGNAVTTVDGEFRRRIVAVEVTNIEVLLGDSCVLVVRGLAEEMICNKAANSVIAHPENRIIKCTSLRSIVEF